MTSHQLTYSSFLIIFASLAQCGLTLVYSDDDATAKKKAVKKEAAPEAKADKPAKAAKGKGKAK